MQNVDYRIRNVNSEQLTRSSLRLQQRDTMLGLTHTTPPIVEPYMSREKVPGPCLLYRPAPTHTNIIPAPSPATSSAAIPGIESPGAPPPEDPSGFAVLLEPSLPEVGFVAVDAALVLVFVAVPVGSVKLSVGRSNVSVSVSTGVNVAIVFAVVEVDVDVENANEDVVKVEVEVKCTVVWRVDVTVDVPGLTVIVDGGGAVPEQISPSGQQPPSSQYVPARQKLPSV